MEIQQSFSIYNKFREEKEKYSKLYEKYGKSYDIEISYNKYHNSIDYVQKGADDKRKLSVKYSSDGKIADVFAYTERGGCKNWRCLTKLLNNLESKKFYYEINYENPFSTVAPPTLSACQQEGMFDIMMQTANDYITQTNQNVTLAVSFEAYGWSKAPMARVIHKRDAKEAYSEYGSFKKIEVYNPDILYAMKYYEDKEKDNIFMDVNNLEEGR